MSFKNQKHSQGTKFLKKKKKKEKKTAPVANTVRPLCHATWFGEGL